MTKPVSILVHMPFCPNKCRYCALGQSFANIPQMGPYCEALEKEILFSAGDMEDLEVRALSLCGGIASYVTAERSAGIIKRIRDNYPLSPAAEIGMRALPGYLNDRKLPLYRDAGLKWIYLDYHTDTVSQCEVLGRDLLPAPLQRAFMLSLKKYAFNLELALMLGQPGQTLADFREFLKRCLDFSPSRIVLVPFGYAPDSPMAEYLRVFGRRYGSAPELRMAGPEEREAMLAFAREFMDAYGMHTSGDGIFALPGRESPLSGLEEQLGFGLGALTRLDGHVSKNTADMERYIAAQGDFTKLQEERAPSVLEG